jgi:uncharacterized protein (DUF362 family)
MSLKVYVDNTTTHGLAATLAAALEWIELSKILFPGARVFIKPNFTYPSYKEGITTSPAVIEETVKLFTDFGAKVTLVESNGGNNAWLAEESFASHNLPYLHDKYGVDIINLSNDPREWAETTIGGKQVRVELPSVLLHESDLFVTLPVPKVHVMTRISYAFKNQWGCIPVVKRFRYHPGFDYNVLAVNKLLRTKIAIYDGTFFLDRTGPMEGDPVPMNLLLAANDPGAGDLACCEIMGFHPGQIKHLRLAQKVGMMPSGLGEVTLNKSLEQFKTHRFTLQRNLKHYVSLIAFNSDLVLRMVANPVIAKPIYKVFYGIFGRPQLTDSESAISSSPES